MKYFPYMLLNVFVMSVSLQAMDLDPEHTDSRDPNMESKLRKLKGVPASPTLAAMTRGYIPQSPQFSKVVCCKQEEGKPTKQSTSPVTLNQFLPDGFQLEDENPMPTKSGNN